MLIDFIGALAAGFACLGMVLMLNRLILRGWLGSWVYPASVALGMIGFTAWAESTWAQRTIDSLPQLELAAEYGEPVFWRPWTYVLPQTTRMAAVDLSQTRTHPAQPDLVMTRVVLLNRWQPMRGIDVVYDCAAGQRADLFDGVTLTAEGALLGANWVPLEAGDPLLRTACAAAAEGAANRREEGEDGQSDGA